MKIKTALVVASGLIVGVATSNAASYQLANLQGGPGVDTLFANSDGSLTNGTGSVSIGYFALGTTTQDIDTIPELLPLLAGFQIQQTGVVGSSTAFPASGYIVEDLFVGPQITSGNPLLGEGVYVIATSATSLGAATINDAFSLFFVRNIQDDLPLEQTYTGNPSGVVPIIGTLGTFNGDLGLGAGEYTTLQMEVIPEPSSLMLGALGALALLRRRR